MPINVRLLETRFANKFPNLSLEAGSQKSDAGLLKMLHMALIMRSEGVKRYRGEENECYFAGDVFTIPQDSFEVICKSIAEGDPLVATYLAGKRRSQLPYCKIYKSAPRHRYNEKKAARIGHAVILVGAGMKKGKRFFYFINSWGNKFCPRKNKKGDLVTAGIGKLRSNHLTKNVVRVHASKGIGGERSLQDQSMLKISRLNYILMTARENQCNPRIIQKMRADDCLGEIEADIMSDGVYEDDEMESMINQEDVTHSVLNIAIDWSGDCFDPCGTATCSHGGWCPPGRCRCRSPSRCAPLPTGQARCSPTSTHGAYPAWAQPSPMGGTDPSLMTSGAAPKLAASSAPPSSMGDTAPNPTASVTPSPMSGVVPYPTHDSASPSPDAPSAVPRMT